MLAITLVIVLLTPCMPCSSQLDLVAAFERKLEVALEAQRQEHERAIASSKGELETIRHELDQKRVDLLAKDNIDEAARRELAASEEIVYVLTTQAALGHMASSPYHPWPRGSISIPPSATWHSLHTALGDTWLPLAPLTSLYTCYGSSSLPMR